MVVMKTFSFPAESHVCELVFAWASGVHVSTGKPVGERRGVRMQGGLGYGLCTQVSNLKEAKGFSKGQNSLWKSITQRL